MEDSSAARPPEHPLRGVRVMVTRPESPCDPLAAELRALGAEVIVQPAIRISDPPDWRPVDDALGRLDTFDWLVFLSANGVRCLLDRDKKSRTPFFFGAASAGQERADTLAGKRAQRRSRPLISAIGPGTADELARYHLQADFVPERFRADVLGESLCRLAQGRRFLVARASRGREVLAEQLLAAGAEVEQVIVYSSIDVPAPDPQVAAKLAAAEIGWVTVTSSAIARSLARLFGDDLRRAKLASISPLTSAALRELGHEPAAEATQYTIPGLIAAMVAEASSSNRSRTTQ